MDFSHIIFLRWKGGFKMKKWIVAILVSITVLAVFIGISLRNNDSSEKVSSHNVSKSKEFNVADLQSSEGPIQNSYTDAHNEGSISKKFVALYTYAFNEGAEFKIFKNGKVFDSWQMDNATGLDIIKYKNPNNLFAYSSTNKKGYKINLNKKETKELTENNSLTLFKIAEGKDLYAFRDENMDYNWFVVKNNDGQIQLNQKLEGYITGATEGEKNYFVSVDIIPEARSVLYVFNKKTNKLTKTIDLSEKYGDDIAIFSNKVVLTTKEKLTIIDLDTWEINELSYPFSDSDPLKLYVYNEKLYMTLNNEKTGLKVVVFNADLNVTRKEDFNFPYTEAIFNEGKLYVASYSLNPNYGGILGEFDLENLKKESQLQLPKSELPEAAFYGFEILD